MQHVLSEIHYFLRKVSKPNNQQIGIFKLIHKFSNIRRPFENSMVKVIKLISSRNNFDTINNNLKITNFILAIGLKNDQYMQFLRL